jgi:hypothetical protein
MDAIWKDVYAYRVWIILLLGQVVSAGIVSLPDPSEKFEFYPWFYRWTHQLLNLKQQASRTDISSSTTTVTPTAVTQTDTAKKEGI